MKNAVSDTHASMELKSSRMFGNVLQDFKRDFVSQLRNPTSCFGLVSADSLYSNSLKLNTSACCSLTGSSVMKVSNCQGPTAVLQAMFLM